MLEEISSIQLTIILLNANLTFERVGSGNLPFDLDICAGVDGGEANDEAQTQPDPNTHFHHPNLYVRI